MRIIIAGGRTFSDYELMERECNRIIGDYKGEIIIVSGTAGGADTLGEKYATEYGYKINRYPANWDFYGKSAGYRRNEVMAQNADALFAFWDGVSAGTGHMIDLAERYNLKVFVIKYGGKQ